MENRTRGAQVGHKHKHGQKRVALSVNQQVKLIEFCDSMAQNKPTYQELTVWAREQFSLPQAPSKGLIAKIMKNKQEIMEKSLEAFNLGRKRKKTICNTQQATLERLLLDWVHNYAAIHGHISDAMMIEKVSRSMPCLMFTRKDINALP